MIALILAAASGAPLGIDPNETISKFIDLGQFAAGGVFGLLLCWGTAWWTGRERATRAELEAEHVQMLIEQLKVKESRIDELHTMLTKLQSAGSGTGTGTKKKG